LTKLPILKFSHLKFDNQCCFFSRRAHGGIIDISIFRTPRKWKDLERLASSIFRQILSNSLTYRKRGSHIELYYSGGF